MMILEKSGKIISSPSIHEKQNRKNCQKMHHKSKTERKKSDSERHWNEKMKT